jgi:hypothetical protein
MLISSLNVLLGDFIASELDSCQRDCKNYNTYHIKPSKPTHCLVFDVESDGMGQRGAKMSR